MPFFLTFQSFFLGSAMAFVLDSFQFLLLGRLVVFIFFPKSTHPLVSILESLTEPVLKEVRKFVPPVGTIDMSGVFVFIAAEFIKFLLSAAGLYV